ncbi:hypothetical protein ZWY2020_023768 [Hordeum vulgare]|nr:hypothetical protein ZWY2020_023768 [Hordeum vulgare]
MGSTVMVSSLRAFAKEVKRQVAMAPRKIPRSCKNLENDKPKRACNSRFLEEAVEQDGPIEVPFYLVAPRASSKRQLMKRASILKGATTGYGCPSGYNGNICYPLSEMEQNLLNSMGGDTLVNENVGLNEYVAAVGGALLNNALLGMVKGKLDLEDACP